jgi:hypothetical protein
MDQVEISNGHREPRLLGASSPAIAAIAAIATVAATATAVAAAAATATAAAATTTTATAPAATTTAAAGATAAAAAATTAATRLALFRLVHADRAAFDERSVELLDGVLRFLRRAHRHEAEAARLAAVTVRHDVNVDHLAERSESGAERLCGGLERQISDIQTITHGSLSTRSRGSSFFVKSSVPMSRQDRTLGCFASRPQERSRDREILVASTG